MGFWAGLSLREVWPREPRVTCCSGIILNSPFSLKSVPAGTWSLTQTAIGKTRDEQCAFLAEEQEDWPCRELLWLGPGLPAPRFIAPMSRLRAFILPSQRPLFLHLSTNTHALLGLPAATCILLGSAAPFPLLGLPLRLTEFQL